MIKVKEILAKAGGKEFGDGPKTEVVRTRGSVVTLRRSDIEIFSGVWGEFSGLNLRQS